jgi:hypothetical protein
MKDTKIGPKKGEPYIVPDSEVEEAVGAAK